MIRRILTAAVAALLLTAAGCSDEKDAKSVTAQPPFWQVEHPDSGAVMYMMGSMHVGEEGLQYPDYVLDALDSCDTLAVELDVSACTREEIVTASRQLLMPDDTDAKQCFGDDYDAVVDFLKEKKLYEKAMEEFIPFFWGSSVALVVAEECGLDSEYGSEEVILARAKEQGKHIHEIESLAEQYAMMAAIPMDIQVMTVLDAVGEENYASQISATREMYEDWVTFDTEGLESLGEMPDLPDELKESYAEYNDLMYVERQQGMAEYAAQSLENGGGVFMMVGAAHFYVEEDIITLLERDGYIVTEVRG